MMCKKLKTLLSLIIILIAIQGTQAQKLTQNQANAFNKDDVSLFKKAFSKEAYSQCYELNGSSYSPLILSIKYNKPHIFSFLMANGTDLNKICTTKTPLMYGAKYGRLAFVKKLLEMGADKQIKNPSNGHTAYDYARRGEYKKIMTLLNEDGSKHPLIISADGPIIVYDNDHIINYQIVPKGHSFRIVKRQIKTGDSLTCYVGATKDLFRFQLKSHLEIEPTEYTLPQKMLVISDIEGNFKGLKSILIGNHIIDENFNWTFGKNHLVLLGDFFDRGKNVTACLWLIYKLEKEAALQGGKIHFILGNHEMMNLKGHLSYVSNKYLNNADAMGLDYKEWYAKNTALGKWLRTKNGVEKIGKYLFVHAGICKDFPKNYTLKEINDHIRKAIDQSPKIQEQDSTKIFIGRNSPLWYRGIALKKETQQDVENTLNNYNASKMIIGHTILGAIKYLYNKKVIAIDLDHAENSKKGKMHALWFDQHKGFQITNQDGKKTAIQ